MNSTLQRIRFTDEALTLPAVQGFDCGNEAWAAEVAAYLKDPNGVAEWVKQGTDAWLYVTEQGELVGYSTLSGREWRWPDARKSPRQPINVIPAVAVHLRFQGQPREPGTKKYADQILDHLRFEAMQHSERLPLLALCVHPLNERAIKWYQRSGFKRLVGDYIDRETGVAYWRMVLNLVNVDEQGNIVRDPQ